jgi:truncated hemoglobin YjbI
VIVAALFCSVGASTSSRATAQGKSLYQRVGGYDVLAGIVDDFIGRLVSDKQFEKFFAGFSNDSKKKIRQHLLDQLCAATRVGPAFTWVAT